MIQKLIVDSAANCPARRLGLPIDTMAVETGGTVPASTVKATEALQPVHRTIIKLTDLAVALSDTNVGGGSLIYTFPEGRIRILDAIALAITPTTTSVIASTLNASKTLSVGVGSVQTTTQQSGTLATTQQNIVNQFSATSSATINVAGTAGNGILASDVVLDGTSAAAALYLNVGVPTNTDIDADATITVSGTVIVTWYHVGDY